MCSGWRPHSHAGQTYRRRSGTARASFNRSSQIPASQETTEMPSRPTSQPNISTETTGTPTVMKANITSTRWSRFLGRSRNTLRQASQRTRDRRLRQYLAQVYGTSWPQYGQIMRFGGRWSLVAEGVGEVVRAGCGHDGG